MYNIFSAKGSKNKHIYTGIIHNMAVSRNFSLRATEYPDLNI